MGTDNLFHKRKARKARDLARRKGRRAPYDKVLIVCEGEKTEPHYFNELKDHYGLNSANIEICGDCGSDPLSIIHYAKKRYRAERDAGDAFDKVFCVFDKDTHANYQQGLDEIRRATPKDVYVAITSVPCFEYWLLLHFKYTTRPYGQMEGNSACNQVITDLKEYMPKYTKGNTGIFPELLGQLDFAKKNAEHALQHATNTLTDNPTTKVHEILTFMENIK